MDPEAINTTALSLDTVTLVYWYMLLVNVAVYMFTALALLVFRRPVARLHASLMGIPEERLYELYFLYLAGYKLLLIVFILIPWLACSLAGGAW